MAKRPILLPHELQPQDVFELSSTLPQGSLAAVGGTFAGLLCATLAEIGAIGRTVTPQGIARRLDSTGKNLTITPRVPLFLNAFTLIFQFQQIGTVNNGGTMLNLPATSGSANKIDMYTLSTGVVRLDLYSSAGFSVTSVDTAAIVANGGLYTLVLVCDGATLQWYANGAPSGSSASISVGRNGEATSFQVAGAGAGAAANQDLALFAVVPSAVTTADARWLSRMPYGYLIEPLRIWVPASSSVSNPIVVSPAVGHLVATGRVPSVVVGAGAFVSPAAGHMLLAGRLPTVAVGAAVGVAPAAGHLALSGRVPTVASGAAIESQPASGHLHLAGSTPLVSQGSAHDLVPALAHLVLGGQQPQVVQGAGTAVQPATGHLAITGRQPSVFVGLQVQVQPATGHLAVSGGAPVVQQGVSTSVLPSTGHLQFQGRAPTVSAGAPISIAIVGGHLQLGGRVPLVTNGAGRTVVPAAGHLRLRGGLPGYLVHGSLAGSVRAGESARRASVVHDRRSASISTGRRRN